MSDPGRRAVGEAATPQRWQDVLPFGRETAGVWIQHVQAMAARASTTMYLTNIQHFLNCTAPLPDEELSSLHGFEFGNDVLNTGVTGTRFSYSLTLSA